MKVLSSLFFTALLSGVNAHQTKAADPDVRLRLLLGSLVVIMSCDSVPTADPEISLTVKNVGSSQIAIPNEPIEDIIDLAVKDNSGKMILAGRRYGGGEFSVGDRLLLPGQQLLLDYLVDGASSPGSPSPLSMWGFRGLTTGTYRVMAAAAKPAKAALSSQCIVKVR